MPAWESPGARDRRLRGKYDDEIEILGPSGLYHEAERTRQGIEARSRDVIPGDAALFAAIDHPVERPDYWFVFYSERMDDMWIMTSSEFINDSHQYKKGRYAGRRTIWFNGKRHNKALGQYDERRKPQFEKYVAVGFSRLRDGH